MAQSSDFENVASVHQVPDEGTLAVARSDGLRICLIKSRGRISAIADNCTHQDFEMNLGDILPDGTIQCAWHGARFDCLTGQVKQGPTLEPIRVYAVRIDGDHVLIESEASQ